MRFDERQIEEVKDYILQQLPRVLEEDPKFSLFIEGLLSEKFPRRDEFARLLDEMSSLREEQRQRFQQVDQRLDGVSQDVQGLREETQNLREETQSIGQDTQTLHQDMQNLGRDMRNLRDWVELTVGRLQTRSGRRLEDVVAGALRLGLQRPDIAPENIRMRQRISDPQGLVFRPGREREVDLVAQDGELLVFEVKGAPDAEDVTDFAEKVELVRQQNPDKRVTGVLIVLGADEDIRRLSAEHGLVLIP